MFRSLRAKRGNLQLLWGSHLEIATACKARLAMTIAAFFNSLLGINMAGAPEHKFEHRVKQP